MGFGSRVKVCSKDELCDYVGIDCFFYIYYTSLHLFWAYLDYPSNKWDIGTGGEWIWNR